mgnify:CR=1 FL=1
MKFVDIFNIIKNSLEKFELSNIDAIVELDEIKLASMGSNDTEGYQIFTPDFVVKDMVKTIGTNNILDITKTILEPTSGDGAFTVYIASERLKKVFKDDRANFEINSLIAISTIYSIEMDKELILKQRNNVFTLYKKFIEKNKISVQENYFDILKCIISTNFIWAMFNSNNAISEFSLFSPEIAYKMPEAEKENYKSLDMPVWEISSDNISLKREGVELW